MIARRYHVSLASLSEINLLPPRTKLPRGKLILVPIRAKTQMAALKNPKKGKGARLQKTVAAARPPAGPGPASRTYRVRGGDTLYRIALKHGTTVALLMTANSLSSDDIHPGDRLTIPARNR